MPKECPDLTRVFITTIQCYHTMVIDYFTEWVEVASYATFNSKEVARFLTTSIICRYGVPHELISDHVSHFNDETVKLLARCKI